MMRKKIRIVSLCVVLIMLTGCAAGVSLNAPVIGGLYAEYKAPLSAGGSDALPYRVGTAECRSILGWVATGDCSIATAAKNGGISRIHHVDYEFKQILQIVGTYKVIVYGE